jgi:hypothetical protein
VVLYLACGSLQDIRKDDAFRRIALMNKLTYETFGLDKTRGEDQDRYKASKCGQ